MSSVRLRGNTFLVLLFRAGNSMLSANSEFGVNNTVTKPALFADLLSLINPEEKVSVTKTLKTYLSQYLDGSKWSSHKYFNFSSLLYRSAFETTMENNYDGEIEGMSNICNTYLAVDSPSKMQQLAGGLIDALNEDETIDSDAVFFTGADDLTKFQLKDCNEVNLPAFLLSVWYHIVIYHWDASEGAETYQAWTVDTGYSKPREPEVDIGNDWIGRIKIDFDTAGIKKEAQPEEPVEPNKENINYDDASQSSDEKQTSNNSNCTWEDPKKKHSSQEGNTNQAIYINSGSGQQNNLSGNFTINLKLGGDKND